MLNALESILYRLKALDLPSRSPHSPPSSPSGPSSCSPSSITVEVPVVSLSASRRLFKIENPPPSLKGCMERPDEYERAVKHWALPEADERNKNALFLTCGFSPSARQPSRAVSVFASRV
jgi:hypothetical protein